MAGSGKFCTSVSCMDGRIQIPIIQWLKENHYVNYVDTITEPGVDIRIFGKEQARVYRRMGVVLANDLKTARDAAAKISINIV